MFYVCVYGDYQLGGQGPLINQGFKVVHGCAFIPTVKREEFGIHQICKEAFEILVTCMRTPTYHYAPRYNLGARPGTRVSLRPFRIIHVPLHQSKRLMALYY